MKKILVVDDEVLRRELIREVLCSGLAKYEIEFADTFHVAKDCIEKNVYDIILLDHDLASNDIRETGYALAKIIKTTENVHAVVIVISLNPVGADNILSVLANRSLKCPVYLLREQWNNIEKEFLL